ncbi:LytR family transcriptional attenuator [Streptohalobacillus salinus]|uniref:LytR family transcriptional attenuator n=1 Tax=Streptohalobacillus salinus TaxID=621096 RepID=A0A2V3WCI9_9BACI|nr:LCP family protein [Streptohalobacillus salinus]PXW92022.1 LytR family transcriptional attenuator [Streptohalobacillus salinus]
MDQMTTRQQRKKRKKRRRKWLLITPFLIVFTIAILYLANVYFTAKSTIDNAHDSNTRSGSDLRDGLVDPSKDHVSVLFIGVDRGGARETSSNGLSDALILATFNKDLKSVKMLSIPRDSYVYVPMRDTYTKINHAHAYGGPTATIDTIEHLFEIPVDYYVSVNFDAFIDVVDALNGIKVEVPYELHEMDSNDTKNAIHLLPGMQSLDGEEALALARTRKMDSDLERGKRQQLIMTAIFDKAVSMDGVINVNDVIRAVGDNMKTSMTFNEMTSFIPFLSKGSINIESLNLEGHDLWTDAYYFELDEVHLEEVKQELKDHLEL